ncbi:hypothetical protein WMY93_031098 [Mugilogobius chulae]|uniref:Uncharacterized protein n=1 Tax=Mugilogobius chulae TaxID=88201 RepID=A0AAW0MGR8_9GOBI
MSGSYSICSKRAQTVSPDSCYDCPHASAVATLKREILELKKALDRERELKMQCTPEAVFSGQGEHNTETRECILRELNWCKNELKCAQEALCDSREENDALRVSLSAMRTDHQRSNTRSQGCSNVKGLAESDTVFNWVGRHYLAVSLPEEFMFKPGQRITPSSVLQKLYEIRVGDKFSASFGMLLENINLMLSHLEPEWYAKHFAFSQARIHGNKYKSAERLDVEDFAWLIFEYRVHAPLVEVLAGLFNVLNSTGKGGITKEALETSKAAYRSYFSLFREAVSEAYHEFARVREKAKETRDALGHVCVPLTHGLSDERRDPGRAKRHVLGSVLNSSEPPAHLSLGSLGEVKDAWVDPFGVNSSLSSFSNLRGLQPQQQQQQKQTKQKHIHQSTRSNCTPNQVKASTVRVADQVIFDSNFS